MTSSSSADSFSASLGSVTTSSSTSGEILVTYPEALFEKVLSKKELNRNTFKIKTGDDLSIEFINNVLFEYHFKRVDFVTEPGEFSVRGGIVDVFSFAHDTPYRIEFFGDEVESIRTFDIATQLSLKTTNLGNPTALPPST